jgi:CDP-4-dehydro-6-deoxyglucose reductase
VSHFQYFPLLSNVSKDTLASKVLERHQRSLNAWQMVISGPFEMAYQLRDVLVAAGAAPEHLYSDAF